MDKCGGGGVDGLVHRVVAAEAAVGKGKKRKVPEPTHVQVVSPFFAEPVTLPVASAHAAILPEGETSALRDFLAAIKGPVRGLPSCALCLQWP